MKNRDYDDLFDYRLNKINEKKKAEREASSFYIVTSNVDGKTFRFNSPRLIPYEYKVNPLKFEILKIRYEDMRDNDKIHTLFHPVIVEKVGFSQLEKLLYLELIELGYQAKEDFLFNSKIKGGIKVYHLDFSFPRQKINVECDGEPWHERCKIPGENKKRDHFLKQNDWNILRFNASSITNNLNEVIKKIQYELKAS